MKIGIARGVPIRRASRGTDAPVPLDWTRARC
jgi:hypothetical protein